MHLYNVILIIYLQLIIGLINDFYYRRRLSTSIIVINGEKNSKLKNYYKKKIRRDRD